MGERAFTNAAFVEYLAEHRLMASRCQTCGALYLPPRPLCPACQRTDMVWVELDGAGTLVAYTTIHIPPTAMIEEGYGRDAPYCTGVVRLAEGPSISAQIVSVEARQPEQIALGTPLRVTFVERGDGDARRTYLAFEP